MSFAQDIVEISDDFDDDCVMESMINKLNYDSICNENPLLAEFMDKCISLEDTIWMKNILNEKLLKDYNQADKNFKTSQEFQNFLKRALDTLKTNSGRKFSLIKELCQILCSGEIKKRVDFITLDNKKKVKTLSLKRKRVSQIECNIPKKNKHLDSDRVESNVSIDEKCEKENQDLNSSQESNKDENKLLIPYKALECDQIEDNCNKEKIRKLEAKIESHKLKIEKLDAEEVLHDNIDSPYLKSEKLKAELVSLYEELCTLSGEAPVKRKEICLQVPEGHPAGPVKRLERFLNKNIGSDGFTIPFPNFRDVVKCVLISNEKDKLGWNKQQIMMEARVVFSHCGRALQKRRQNREWRDLLSKVNSEEFDGDPADNDRELLARLEANKKIALRKEAEILERFTMMQNMPPQKNCPVTNEMRDSDDCSDKSEYYISSDEESTNQTSLSQIASTSNNNNGTLNDVKSIGINDSLDSIKDRKELESSIIQQLEELGDDYVTKVEIEDSYHIP